MSDSLSTYLDNKVAEYRIMSAPLERASNEIQYSRQLLRARLESEIADDVPALGAIADILNVSVLDMLTASDRADFVHKAMIGSGLEIEDVMHQLRSIGAPPAREDLALLGLGSTA